MQSSSEFTQVHANLFKIQLSSADVLARSWVLPSDGSTLQNLMTASKPEQERMFLLVNKVAILMVIQAGKKGLVAMEMKGWW